MQMKLISPAAHRCSMLPMTQETLFEFTGPLISINTACHSPPEWTSDMDPAGSLNLFTTSLASSTKWLTNECSNRNWFPVKTAKSPAGTRVSFTLIAESAQRYQEIIKDLQARTGVEKIFILPALKVYKIRVNFQVGPADPQASAPLALNRSGLGPPASRPSEPVKLSEDQKALVRLLQESIPLVDEPFAAIGEQIGWPAEQVIKQIDNWRANGVIRRFGVVVIHQRLGFSANGMAVFSVPDDQIDRLGEQLAKRPEISHCYHRPPLEGFDFTLYAMVHGQSESQVHSIVAEILCEIGPHEHTVLFSTTEYKKTSAKYFL